MTIKQGDAYSIMISLKDDSGEPITDAVVGSAEVVLGGITKTYPESVTYDAEGGCFIFPITQTESHSLTGILPFQIRLKFLNGDVIGTSLGTVEVSVSASSEVI